MRRYILVIQVLVLLHLPAVASQASLPDALPSLIRIAVIDTSGSMTGPRITTAKAELRALARRLPPTKDRPLIVIPFDTAPHHVATFIDLPTCEAFLDRLDAGGGTSIASGLNRGLDELKPYANCPNIVFLLYTDGEDGDQAGVEAAEAQLDRFFATRSKQGLPSLLFAKRWENANSALLTKIAKSGHVQLIDAGELQVVPVTVIPTVTVVGTAWAKDAPLILELDCHAKLELKGLPFDSSYPAVPLTCTDPGAVLPPVALRPGDPQPVSFRLRLPVTPAGAATGTTTAHFKTGAIGKFSSKDGIVLPLVTQQIDVPVILAALKLQFSATLVEARLPSWSDPLAAKPAQHLTLTCSVQSGPVLQWPSPLTIRVKACSGRLLPGKHTLEFRGPGSASLPLSVEADAVTTGASTFAVALVAQSEPTGVFVVDPPEIELMRDSKLPGAVDTTITAQVQKVSDARWTDLVQGLAAFEADVAFDVSGPVPADTKLVLICPASVRSFRIDPTILHAGNQLVRLSLQAHFPGAPRVPAFDIQIEPPAPTAILRFVAPPPLHLRVPSPAPVQLALLRPDGASPEVTVRDRAAPILLTGTPVLLGHEPVTAADGVAAVVRSGPLLDLKGFAPVPIGTLVVLPVRLPEMETSFFFDTTIQESIEVLPSRPSPALTGSQQFCAVTIEAPFKRVCFYVAITLAALLLTALIGRLILPLAKPQTTRR